MAFEWPLRKSQEVRGYGHSRCEIGKEVAILRFYYSVASLPEMVYARTKVVTMVRFTAALLYGIPASCCFESYYYCIERAVRSNSKYRVLKTSTRIKGSCPKSGKGGQQTVSW